MLFTGFYKFVFTVHVENQKDNLENIDDILVIGVWI